MAPVNVPTPEFNTGLGFHYFPDESHYRAVDLQAWMPELKSMGASWLTLTGSLSKAIPEAFLRPLIEAGIEPIIHLPLLPIQPIDVESLRPLCQSYARWGVRYVVLYTQPNSRTAWPGRDWMTEGLVGRFLDLLLPGLQLVQSAGLVPVFPPLQQGGDYWDTSFLDTALRLLRSRGQKTLLGQLTFGVYGFAGNRPPEWGAGGAARWPASRPYHTPPGSQDQVGFRAFEWYADVMRERLGEVRPMIMVAGGARMGDGNDLNFAPVGAEGHASCNASIATAMLERNLPAYLLNTSFWLLAAGATSPHAAAAWYRGDGTALPAAAAVRELYAEAVKAMSASEKRMPARAGRSGATPEARPKGRPIYHYVLLPGSDPGAADRHEMFVAALEYVREFQPTCGFSLAEAQAAEYVTIIGNEHAISAEAENRLRSAGCQVERVCGSDGGEVQRQLSDKVRTGLRFEGAAAADAQPAARRIGEEEASHDA